MRRARLRLLDLAEEVFDGARVDFDDADRDDAVRLAMACLGGLLVRRIREAEGRLPLVIEPVGDVAHSVPALDLQIPDVGLRQVFGGHTGKLVAVEEERHTFLPAGGRTHYPSSHGSEARGRRGVRRGYGSGPSRWPRISPTP